MFNEVCCSLVEHHQTMSHEAQLLEPLANAQNPEVAHFFNSCAWVSRMVYRLRERETEMVKKCALL
jgi:hypothetical protein